VSVEEHLSTFKEVGFIRAREICPAADLSLMAAKSPKTKLLASVLAIRPVERKGQPNPVRIFKVLNENQTRQSEQIVQIVMPDPVPRRPRASTTPCLDVRGAECQK